MPIDNRPNARNELAEIVEVADISGEDAGAEQARLQANQRIIQKLALVADTLWQSAEAEQLASQHPGLPPSCGFGRMQTMRGNVLNCFSYSSENRLRGGMIWIEPPKYMGKLGEAYGRVVAHAIGEKFVDALR